MCGVDSGLSMSAPRYIEHKNIVSLHYFLLVILISIQDHHISKQLEQQTLPIYTINGWDGV